MKPKMNYEKHVYWVSRDEEAPASGEARQGGRTPAIRPKEWSARPWTKSIESPVSPRKCGTIPAAARGAGTALPTGTGLYLIVSSFPIEGMETARAARITRSSMARPVLMVTEEEKRDMVTAPTVKDRIPARWSEVEDTEKAYSTPVGEAFRVRNRGLRRPVSDPHGEPRQFPQAPVCRGGPG